MPVGQTPVRVRGRPTTGPARWPTPSTPIPRTGERSLPAWGRAVGAGARTLARVWLAETGTSFARWRTLLRMQAALPRLVAGVPVATVAHEVGYATASAFVAAFRRTTGVTPGSYFGRS